MIVLCHGGGASGFEMGDATMDSQDARRLLGNVARVLRARGETKAAEELTKLPFAIVDGTNDFGDQFSVLFAAVPLEAYERLRSADSGTFRIVAQTITEFGPYVRFVAVELAMDPTAELARGTEGASLTTPEIRALVYRYTGVAGGYLGDFTYQTHFDFYVDLGLSINPHDYPGTTRARFEQILGEQMPEVQARILEGLLAKYPPGSSELRTPERISKIQEWISRLKGGSAVSPHTLSITSGIVERALRDAEHLITASGPSSGVDRVHTAFHGYLRALCDRDNLEYQPDATIAALVGVLRKEHPAFANVGPRHEDTKKVFKAMGVIADALNPLRNQASVAHPNSALLEEPEAMLVINTVRTLLAYVDSRVAKAG